MTHRTGRRTAQKSREKDRAESGGVGHARRRRRRVTNARGRPARAKRAAARGPRVRLPPGSKQRAGGAGRRRRCVPAGDGTCARPLSWAKRAADGRRLGQRASGEHGARGGYKPHHQTEAAGSRSTAWRGARATRVSESQGRGPLRRPTPRSGAGWAHDGAILPRGNGRLVVRASVAGVGMVSGGVRARLACQAAGLSSDRRGGRRGEDHREVAREVALERRLVLGVAGAALRGHRRESVEELVRLLRPMAVRLEHARDEVPTVVGPLVGRILVIFC